MAQGTYPRDSISLEEWGKSQEKGEWGGANPVAQLSRDPDQTFRKNILVVTHFLLSPVCQTCDTLRTSPRMAGLRGKDRWGGLARDRPPQSNFLEARGRPAGFRPARAYFSWKGRSHLLFHLELRLTESRRAGRGKDQEVTLAKGPPPARYLSGPGKKRAQRKALKPTVPRRYRLCEQTSQDAKRPI